MERGEGEEEGEGRGERKALRRTTFVQQGECAFTYFLENCSAFGKRKK
jgi:hypothetical protein